MIYLLESKIFPNCGEEFIPHHPRQKYCRRKLIKICPICGKEFTQICEAQMSSVCTDPKCIKASQSFYDPKKSKICPICGKSFLPKTSNQKYCGNTSIQICKICGKEFEYVCKSNSDPNICNDCLHSKYLRTCKICGKQFISKSYSKQICDGPHYRICEICGKQFILPKGREFDTTLTCCSKQCSNVKRSRSIKAAISSKPKGYNRCKTVYKQICKWCGKEFETHCYAQKYCNGPHYQTCEICGKQFEIDLSQIANKCTVCSNECRTIKSVRSLISDPNIYLTWEQFCKDPKTWINQHYDHNPTYYELSKDLKMNSSTIQQKLALNNVEYLVNKHVPTMEQEVSDIIKSFGDFDIIHNSRKIIKPKEIDLYLPDFNIGIECNPTITHNSTRCFCDSIVNHIPPSYHKMKTDMAVKAGIFLFHIYGYEWTHKRDIIVSMLRNLLGCNTIKIYGRKITIKEVSAKDARIFLNENHRQGYAASSIRYGLYYNGELVSLMTFGKMRSTIGKSSGNGCYELVRFCNKLNTSVIGGASKLFKHFISTLDPNYVISFSDRSHTRGNLYKTLGFKEIRRSDPGYVWVRLEDDRAYHRINAQKQNIKRFLKDDSIDLSKSESTIMAEHGFVQVFDSGTIVWEYRKR